MAHEREHKGYVISDDPARLDRDACHALVGSTYWARGIPRGLLDRAIDASLCFGIYAPGDPTRQVGVARVITDEATYAYLCDVVIDEAHRGLGLSVALMEHILAHPRLQGLRRFALLTRDAQGLYARFGFGEVASSLSYMEIARPRMYERGGTPPTP